MAGSSEEVPRGNNMMNANMMNMSPMMPQPPPPRGERKRRKSRQHSGGGWRSPKRADRTGQQRPPQMMPPSLPPPPPTTLPGPPMAGQAPLLHPAPVPPPPRTNVHVSPPPSAGYPVSRRPRGAQAFPAEAPFAPWFVRPPPPKQPEGTPPERMSHEDVVKMAEARLKASVQAPSDQQEIARFKSEYNLGDEVELGLKLLAPVKLRTLFSHKEDLRYKMTSNPAARNALVRKEIAKLDPSAEELVRNLQRQEEQERQQRHGGGASSSAPLLQMPPPPPPQRSHGADGGAAPEAVPKSDRNRSHTANWSSKSRSAAPSSHDNANTDRKTGKAPVPHLFPRSRWIGRTQLPKQLVADASKAKPRRGGKRQVNPKDGWQDQTYASAGSGGTRDNSSYSGPGYGQHGQQQSRAQGSYEAQSRWQDGRGQNSNDSRSRSGRGGNDKAAQFGRDPLVMYVVLRRDLDWPMEKVIIQACHTCASVAWEARADSDATAFFSEREGPMTTVLLGSANKEHLSSIMDSLLRGGMPYKLRFGIPESTVTGLATWPRRRSMLEHFFQGLQRF